jgi:hypothetical protein
LWLLGHAVIGAVGAVAAGPAVAPPTHAQLVLSYVTVYGPPNVTAGVPPQVVQLVDPELLLELLPPELLLLLPPELLPLEVLPLELLAPDPELLPEAPELEPEALDPEPELLALDAPDDDPVELPELFDPEPLELPDPLDPLEPEPPEPEPLELVEPVSVGLVPHCSDRTEMDAKQPTTANTECFFMAAPVMLEKTA